MNGPTPQIASPDDQSATFIELFFDLVFVFALTQVVGLFADGVTWHVVGQAAVVFWLVWWAWTQFTWALNAADTTHPFIELGTLVATGIAFFMAISLPEAFQDRALWFAAPYVLVRIVGLWIFARVTAGHAEMRGGVREFSLLSVGGMSTVLLGGYLGGESQYALWSLAVVLDLFAAKMAGSGSGDARAWRIHPEHFAERHGLIVIIALGETLIVVAGGLTASDLSTQLLGIGVLGVVAGCALWWSYFAKAQVLLADALEHPTRGVRGQLARDSYTLWHFPMICGIVGFAVALESAVHHPSDPLDLGHRLALGVGVVLFVGGMAMAIWRATGRRLWVRMALIVATGTAIVFVPGPGAIFSLSIAAAGLLVIGVVEQRSTSLDLETRGVDPLP